MDAVNTFNAPVPRLPKTVRPRRLLELRYGWSVSLSSAGSGGGERRGRERRRETIPIACIFGAGAKLTVLSAGAITPLLAHKFGGVTSTALSACKQYPGSGSACAGSL